MAWRALNDQLASPVHVKKVVLVLRKIIDGPLRYFYDINGMLTAIFLPMGTSDWHLFIDSSQISLKAIFLNNVIDIIVERMNDRLTFGSRTREFHKAWTTAGHSIRIQEQQVRPFFNTYLDLYPSDSQIHEMVRCAREIEDSSLKEFYLTFGEVCVLASELKTRSDSPNDPPVSITSKNDSIPSLRPPPIQL
ncbi:unnamed protein product [Lepeophtheirus salmonis]|uniref:(salmon louse) hypothetical protein n=1 Tax=Lepeophtheirus salmonis TaxID=72036 RepID=A0A7R8CMM3_LEPSM|nr:unnamed protein product [Lepeophtheirus salmonis]CAF2867105.1 unnamed protein product [Lepeophtheirus salmonis]